MERKRKGKGQGEAKGKGPIKEMHQDQFIFEMSVVKGREEGKGKKHRKATIANVTQEAQNNFCVIAASLL